MGRKSTVESMQCPDCHEALVAVVDGVIQECRACAESRVADLVAKRLAPTVPTPSSPEPRRDGLLSIQEAADYLGIGPSKFKDDVQAQLPAVRIGNRVLFDRKDLDAWAREQKAGGSSDCPRAEDGRRTSSGSGTLASASRSPRAKQILAELQSKPRGSTRT